MKCIWINSFHWCELFLMKRKNFFSKLSSHSSEHDFRALPHLPRPCQGWDWCSDVSWKVITIGELCELASAVLVLSFLVALLNLLYHLWILVASTPHGSTQCTWVLGWWSMQWIQLRFSSGTFVNLGSAQPHTDGFLDRQCLLRLLSLWRASFSTVFPVSLS